MYMMSEEHPQFIFLPHLLTKKAYQYFVDITICHHHTLAKFVNTFYNGGWVQISHYNGSRDLFLYGLAILPLLA